MKIALVVDNPYRDLPGLIIVAMYLAQKGATCHLVPMNLQRWELFALAPDFVLLNYLRLNNQVVAAELMDAGVRIGVLDTEGGVLTSLDAYAKTMASDKAVRKKVARVMMWGRKLAEHCVKREWYDNSQVVVTGSPRFDFYVSPLDRAATAAAPYVQEFGKPMVLLNSNFPIANPRFSTPEKELKTLVEYFKYDLKFAENLQKGQQRIMLGLTDLANRLAAQFPKATFIYRPHPFEKLETYDTLLSRAPNLHLVKQGTVDAWIAGACAVIQRSCSTAIESGMKGVPALSPEWIPSAVTMEAAEVVSIPCQSYDELAEKVGAALENKCQVPEKIQVALREVIADWFNVIDGKSYRRVSDEIFASMSPSGSSTNLDACKSKLYGFSSSLSGAAQTNLRRMLNLPPGFSFKRMRDLVNGEAIKWSSSGKKFDPDDVRRMVTAVSNEDPAFAKCQFKIAPASQDSYAVDYRQGRSVTIRGSSLGV